MGTVSRKCFSDLAEIVLEGGAKRATKYFSEKSVVSAQYFGKRDKRDKRAVVVFKVGAPNYREQEFIKACKAAGEKFPVKKIQIKWAKRAK